MTKSTIAVVVVAAGRGERVSVDPLQLPKQYRHVAGRSVLERSLAAFLGRPDVDWVLPVIHADHHAHFSRLGTAGDKLLQPVIGGKDRQASVLAGLEALESLAPDLVLIQDAARPLVPATVVDDVIDALQASKAALPVTPVTDTIKRSTDGRVTQGTEDRRQLFAAQTPQGFRFSAILEAHRLAAASPEPFTDDAAIAEWAGIEVALTPGSRDNIKITHPEDFERAERLLGDNQPMETRIGTGYDVHSFGPGSSVWLGGVEIAHDRTLSGHSDADVALHALSDALYGALGAGDIGQHFPPSDAQWRGARSTIFLEHAAGLVAARGGRIVNVDITIIAEAPKVGPHAARMREIIGACCGITTDRVGIKATTNEKMGFIGRAEGIAAMASASIELPRGET